MTDEGMKTDSVCTKRSPEAIKAIYDKHLAELRSPDAFVRDRACVKLWGVVSLREDVRKALIVRMLDKNEGVRINAVMAIVSLCGDHADVREAVLKRLLKEKNLNVFTTIVVGLGEEMLDDEDFAATLAKRAAEGPSSFRAIVEQRTRE